MKRTGPAAPAPPPPQDPKNVSLRIPGKLSALAQHCADTTGLSLNGLICTALADYLAARGYKVHSL